LSARNLGAVRRLGLTALGARGSHVFGDSDTTMWTIAGAADLELGERTTLDLRRFVTWPGATTSSQRCGGRTAMSAARGFLYDYDVLDVVARLHRHGSVETELVVDVCRNLARRRGEHGRVARPRSRGRGRGWPRLEYVYVWVDRDATLAAYRRRLPLADRLEGHELKLACRVGDHVVLRATGILSRYKTPPGALPRLVGGPRRLELALRY